MATHPMSTTHTNTLQLAPGWHPDVDMILNNGLAVFGVPGSGKSNLVSLLVEQFSAFYFPQVIFDTENEYGSLLSALPNGVLADCESCPTAYDILTQGMQVVVNLKSWGSRQSAALAMADLVESLFAVASAQSPIDRVPCAIHLDEAAVWLPQKAVSYLSKETSSQLFEIFNTLGTRGRKYGLRPFIYTQYVSQIQKDIIRSCALRVFMRQTEVLDLNRYGEYLQPFSADMRLQVSSFKAGQAIIHGLPDGTRPMLRFYEQMTQHQSHTPSVNVALSKFAPSGYQIPIVSPAVSVQEPIPFSVLQARQVKQQPLPSVFEKVLGYIEKYQGSEDLQLLPTCRNLTRYLKAFSREEIQQALIGLVCNGQIYEQKQGKATVYYLEGKRNNH